MLINGKADTQIAATDRGLQFGDGLFETIAIKDGQPCLWRRHLDRLLSGCSRLAITPPDADQLYDEVFKEIGEEKQGVIKIIVTRGPGKRGYRPQSNTTPTRIVNWNRSPAFPDQVYQRGIIARLCSTRLGWNPALAGLKHLNRLEQVLARSEWHDPSIQEGLMMDAADRVIEGTSSNLFVIQNDKLHTPDLSRCGVAGVMQGLIIEVAEELDIPIVVSDISLHDLWTADSLFVSNSLIGIWPIRELSGQEFSLDAIPDKLMDTILDRGFRNE
ncbi:aminodeoxychorismate lyase [Sedimenticola sp.]|uniref:aminodeoxychorismate lyase n=1 Tax=Sedimenticola sp. TaxID=1940285 RepID=UPI003D0CC018